MARKPVTDLSAWPSLTLEGNLIAPAMVASLAAPKDDEETRQSYRIRKGLSIRDEISTAFRVGQSHFDAFRKHEKPSAEATRRFMRDFLAETLGFDDLAPHEGAVCLLAGGRVPIVVTPPDEEKLDRKSATLSTDRSRSAAFALQDYLNDRDDALWGLATNGTVLRLMRDNASLTRPAYIEADLAQIFTNEDAASFAVLWLLCHCTRFGLADTPATDCALERWRDAGAKEGEAARDRLAGQVQLALKLLGSGFLEANPDLSKRLQSGDIPLTGWFNELLRLVYRLIFLMVAEDRNLLHPPKAPAAARKLYAEGYSLTALRTLCTRGATWDRHHDRYEGVKILFRSLATGEEKLALPALGGLFASDQLPHLGTARLRNRAFMEALYRLSWLTDEKKTGMVPVNWRAMETEELGSVYESLLELQPQLGSDGRTLLFASDAAEQRGNQRKTTGSFYTPDTLVQALLDTALNPVLDQIENNPSSFILHNSSFHPEPLLRLRVIDPACGSGHFLLAAARRIATRLARIRADGTPSTEDFRHALRDAARCCIHGVDRNPMAVELTKVALWIETVDPGLPLGFFDAQIRCGDALLGVFDLKVLQDGIPDAAYKPLTGDDKDTSKYYAQANKDAKKGQGHLGYDSGQNQMPDPKPLAADFSDFRDLPEETVEQIGAKAKRLESLRKGPDFLRTQTACDLYIAAFLLPKTGGAPTDPSKRSVPTTQELWHTLNNSSSLHPSSFIIHNSIAAARRARAFHWPLEFPDVMQRGGFDVVVGNPPFLSAIEQANSEDPRARNYVQHTFESAKGAFDLYVPFIERGAALAIKGTSCLLTPNKFLSAPYGEALRTYIASKDLLCSVDDFSRGNHFADASVYPIVTTLRHNPRADVYVVIRRHCDSESRTFRVHRQVLNTLPSRNLGPLLSDDVDRLFAVIEKCIPFSKVAEINASTTAAEADEYTAAIDDAGEMAGGYWKVVNTGTIDPFRPLWGMKPMRHAKSEYMQPAFSLKSPFISARRKEQYSSPKIVFAKIGSETEAFFDENGDFAGLNINFAFVGGDHGKFLTAYVNSSLGSWIYRQLFGALAMSGGYLQYQSPQIRDWPVPQYDPMNQTHKMVVRAYDDFLGGSATRASLDDLINTVFEV